MRTVFEAVANQNPFPAESFPQSAWNHSVLKTLFLDSVLHPIIGLLEDKYLRAQIELAKTLICRL